MFVDPGSQSNPGPRIVDEQRREFPIDLVVILRNSIAGSPDTSWNEWIQIYRFNQNKPSGAQLVKFHIDISFWSNFEPVEISQKFNFLSTDYDYRKFLKASWMHRGMKRINTMWSSRKFLLPNLSPSNTTFPVEKSSFMLYAICYNQSIFKNPNWTFLVPIAK